MGPLPQDTFKGRFLLGNGRAELRQNPVPHTGACFGGEVNVLAVELMV